MNRLSRREFGGAVAAAVGAVVIPVRAPAQDQALAVRSADVDVRVRLIEQSRGKEFTPVQRKAVQESVANTDKQWIEGRKFVVPDNTEPAFAFHPAPAPRRRTKP